MTRFSKACAQTKCVTDVPGQFVTDVPGSYLVGFSLVDAVFVGDGSISTRFVVGVAGERWGAGTGDGFELEFCGPGVSDRRDLVAPGEFAAQAVGIVFVADAARGAAGEGLGFRSQFVAGVVGKVTS